MGKQSGFKTSSMREAYMKRLKPGNLDTRRNSEFTPAGTENEFSKPYKHSRTQDENVSPRRENDTFYKVLGPAEAKFQRTTTINLTQWDESKELEDHLNLNILDTEVSHFEISQQINSDPSNPYLKKKLRKAVTNVRDRDGQLKKPT